MPNNISKTKFYKIINNAIKNCTNSNAEVVNREMQLFSEKYDYYCQNNEQLDVFEQIPSANDIQDGVNFCDTLDEYRCSIDEYQKENETLSAYQYRYILKKMDEYKEIILPENKKIAEVLEKSIKGHLPEYREELILENYNKRAQDIYEQKNYNQHHQDTKRIKDNEQSALDFFEDVFRDKELKNIGFNPDKLTLYQNSLLIVDCLPTERYSRTEKYKLKKQLNTAIRRTAEALGGEYSDITHKAAKEEKRYEQAISQAKYYVKKKNDSFTARNRKALEEWICK